MRLAEKTIKYPVNFKIILFLFWGCTLLLGQSKPILKFSDSGRFKIVQFTDIHFAIENSEMADGILATIRSVLEVEKPDFVILTGDIATSKKVKESWSAITGPMVEAGIPWAAVMGNHEHEYGLTNKEVIDYLLTIPLNLTSQGPSEISGAGNYVLEISGSKSNKTEALMYCFDSHDYTGESDYKEPGIYGWIKFDQIAWYRNLSKKYTALNNNKPYPAFAFFHIPLPEYSMVQKKELTVGDNKAPVCSPNINSGMYNAFYESKDVMAAFCGHDHENNFIGTFNNIALAYGCKTGKVSSGNFYNGGRVIVLYEGMRKFDTWIRMTKDSVRYNATYPDTFKK